MGDFFKSLQNLLLTLAINLIIIFTIILRFRGAGP